MLTAHQYTLDMGEFLSYTHQQADAAVINGQFYPQLWNITPGSYLADLVIEELLRNDNFCHGQNAVSYES
jgi:hypothetical protein